MRYEFGYRRVMEVYRFRALFGSLVRELLSGIRRGERGGLIARMACGVYLVGK